MNADQDSHLRHVRLSGCAIERTIRAIPSFAPFGRTGLLELFAPNLIAERPKLIVIPETMPDAFRTRG